MPLGWIEARLEEFSLINPRNIPGLIDELDISFLPMSSVDEESGRFCADQTRKVKDVKRGYTPFMDGDVVFAKITPCMENGKAAVVSGLRSGLGFGSTEFHIIRPLNNISSKYIFFYLVQRSYRKNARLNMSGSAGQLRVSKDFLSESLLPLAPLLEQYRIVAKIEELFSSLDKSIENLKAAQQQLKLYRQAVLKWAFEGRLTNKNVREGQLPEGWLPKNLGDLSEKIQIGPFGSQLHKQDYIVGGVPLINPMHLKDGVIEADPSYSISQKKRDELPNYILKEGDVIMGRRGEMGRCGLVGKRESGWCCGTGSLYIRPKAKAVKSPFLYHYLQSQGVKKYLEENAAGTTMANLNSRIIDSIPLLLPPFKQQELIIAEIESRLSVCEKIEETINNALKQADSLRQSILKRAFEGKLVPQDPNDEPASVLLARIKAEREKNKAEPQTIDRMRKGKGSGRKRKDKGPQEAAK